MFPCNEESYKKHEGCAIRNIFIHVYDPFEIPIDDSINKNLKILHKGIDKLHFKTRKKIIYNKILFHEGEPLLPLKISESERALRQTGYITDVRISVEETIDKDSVDVLITVLDKWAVTFPLEIRSLNSYRLSLRNSNLMGLGHFFEQTLDIKESSDKVLSGKYFIENIDHTFISGGLFYSKEKIPLTLGIDIQRTSFSTLIKWGGGIYIENKTDKFTFKLPVGKDTLFPVQKTRYDNWILRRLNCKFLGERLRDITGVSLAARVFATEYNRRPPLIFENKNDYFLNNGILWSTGFYLQQYYKEKFIYGFGVSEDVPVGIIFQVTHGFYHQEQNTSKNFFSFNSRIAHKFKVGYLSNSLTVATYSNKKITNQVLFKGSVYFFSNIILIKKWMFRQFFHLDFNADINHNLEKKITLRSSDIYSIPVQDKQGFLKLLFNMETVAYAPFDLFGFRFAPVFMFGSGFIDEETKGLNHVKFFHAVALGILFRNENLLRNTFQISAGFYPVLNDSGKRHFVIGPIASFSLRVNGFSANKPDFTDY
jgi:hypothetical protein